MKKLLIILLFINLVFLFSCQKKEQNKIIETNDLFNEKKELSNEQIIAKENEFQDYPVINPLLLLFNENPEWFTEHVWYLDGGHIDYSPIVTFKKQEIPVGCTLYQRRLRDEYFHFYYQPEDENNKLIHYKIKEKNIFDLTFRDEYSFMGLYDDGKFHTGGSRVGQIENHDYPLVGTWGQLPALSEYRLADYTDSAYLMEISEINIGHGAPGSDLRMGTYLLKQTGVKTFETISSFYDGLLSLDILSEKTIMMTQLFTLSDDDERDFYGYYRIIREE